MTPTERRFRIYELAEVDEEYRKMLEEYKPAKAWFEKAVGWMPPRLRNRFWGYPGMGYFLHHRMLTIICRNMRFHDETE